MAKVRMPKDKVPARGGRSNGPKDAPAPVIPRPKINQHGTTPKQPGTGPKPEMQPQQLNPIKGKPGQPQYQDEDMGSNALRAVIAALRGS